MKNFIDFFKDEEIIIYLCRVRAKYAKQRNKKHLLHLLTASEKHNYHITDTDKESEYEKQFQKDLKKLFPPRKKWKDLGNKSRYKGLTNQKLSSVDKNVYSLLKTIKYFKKTNPQEPFLVELESFIKDVRSSVQKSEYNISPPIIYPKPKDKKQAHELAANEKNVCRPIALFTLKDRLILSFTNKYLTQLFDSYFDDCSLAFRSVQKLNGKKVVINHHTAVKRIIEYRKAHANIPLWVAECDMKKFYDSVNHTVITQKFDALMAKAREHFPKLDLTIPERIFYKYLDCYAFNVDVLKYNSKDLYWENYKIAKGEFGWVEKDLETLGYYENINLERIGVPQGGALSGLIANIVLDSADKKMMHDEILYIRFCDDMILMHPNQIVCATKVVHYKNALLELRLVPHKFCSEAELKSNRNIKNSKLPSLSLSKFWKEKSKGPYRWDEVNRNGFPWIGFVGYEVHFTGLLRVRKASIQKELDKQKEVINQIEHAIKNDKRASNGTVTESAIHRLIGMSIGRVELWNYTEIENEMCWKNGFKELTSNKHSIKQLKALDRGRNKLYYRLVKNLQSNKADSVEDGSKKALNRQILAYNKPFSYFYQVAERVIKEEN